VGFSTGVINMESKKKDKKEVEKRTEQDVTPSKEITAISA
jgi:hypothetical protein